MPFYHQSDLKTFLALSGAVVLYELKTKPNIQLLRGFRAETKYVRPKRTIGVYVFVVLPTIRPKNFPGVIGRTHVLLAQTKHNI